MNGKQHYRKCGVYSDDAEDMVCDCGLWPTGFHPAAQPAQTEPVAWPFQRSPDEVARALIMARNNGYSMLEAVRDVLIDNAGPLYAAPAAQPAQIPREPTDPMREVGEHKRANGYSAQDIWRAMHDAAPKAAPPAALPEDELHRAVAAAERERAESPTGQMLYMPRDYMRSLLACARDRLAAPAALPEPETPQQWAERFGKILASTPSDYAKDQPLDIRLARAAAVLPEGDARPQGVTDLEEMAWVLIANAGEGFWERERKDWQEAAAKWRDQYHAKLSSPSSTAQPSVPEPCPRCKGTGRIEVSSFADPRKNIEKSCNICRGRGTLAASPSTTAPSSAEKK